MKPQFNISPYIGIILTFYLISVSCNSKNLIIWKWQSADNKVTITDTLGNEKISKLSTLKIELDSLLLIHIAKNDSLLIDNTELNFSKPKDYIFNGDTIEVVKFHLFEKNLINYGIYTHKFGTIIYYSMHENIYSLKVIENNNPGKTKKILLEPLISQIFSDTVFFPIIPIPEPNKEH